MLRSADDNLLNVRRSGRAVGEVRQPVALFPLGGNAPVEPTNATPVMSGAGLSVGAWLSAPWLAAYIASRP